MRTRQRLRFLHITRVVKQVESKELFRLLDHFLGVIEALRMHFEDSGRIDREGAVHVDGNRWYRALLRERVERVDHLLGATKRKGRDQDSAASRSSFANYLGKLSFGSFYRLMFPIAVRRLHDQRIGTFCWNRIPDDR